VVGELEVIINLSMLFFPENCLKKKFYEHEAFPLIPDIFTKAAKVCSNVTPDRDMKIKK